MAKNNEKAYAEAIKRIEAVTESGATKLDLTIRQLEVIPAQIANLNKLKVLALDNSKVSDLSPIEVLSSLVRLSVSNTKVFDLAPIEKLTKLTALVLDESEVTDLSPIESLSSLVHLSANNTKVFDLGPIEKLTNLTYLDLHLTGVRDFASISNLTKLEVLDLAYQVGSDVSAMANLSNLRIINLKNNSVLDFRPFRNILDTDRIWDQLFVQWQNAELESFDPELYEMIYSDSLGKCLDYLKNIDDAKYDLRIAKWHATKAIEMAPEQADLLRVSVVDG